MRTFRVLVWLLAANFVLAFPPPPAAAAPPPDDCQYTEDGTCIPSPDSAKRGARQMEVTPTAPLRPNVLVRRKSSVTATRFGATLSASGFERPAGLLSPGWWRLPVPAGRDRAAFMARLKAMPEVEEVSDEQSVYSFVNPNDPALYQQWGVLKAQATFGWNAGFGDRGVLIAIVDTGVDVDTDAHPDRLADRHPDAPSYLTWGRNFAYDVDDSTDDHGHGTHVAGIASAAAGNQVGIAGICPRCDVLAVKVLDAFGSGTESDVADGITYAVNYGQAQAKRTIINLSLGLPYGAPLPALLADVIADARARGALVVAAAGNYGQGREASYPASLPGVVAVSATDRSDGVAWFSQYGTIAAPGVDIYSTVTHARYSALNGTSMASPFIAGVAGLIWSSYPTYTASQVKDALLAGVDVPRSWNPSYGTGRINVFSAVTGRRLHSASMEANRNN